MISNQPLFSIEALPYLVDCNPAGRLLLVAFDDSDGIADASSFPLDVDRPLDDVVLDIIGWSSNVTSLVAVAYTEQQDLDLRPVLDAARESDRSVVHAVRAGRSRWRSYLCERPRCCPAAGNRYPQSVPGHQDYRPLPARDDNPRQWRANSWHLWQQTLQMEPPTSGPILSELARSLFDIPLRDAVLALSAREDNRWRPAIQALLAAMTDRSPLATSLPAHTCSAALAYLDGDLDVARTQVNDVLGIDEYSLARLLRNGLDMRAPASLLARSFSHFDPVDLLAA